MPSRSFRPRNWGEAFETARKMPTYARLIWGLARDPRVPVQQKAVLAGIAAYLAFPIDLIPDFIPIIGQLDDLLVDAGLLGLMTRAVMRYYALKRISKGGMRSMFRTLFTRRILGRFFRR